ncbi:MAG: radical SAM protein [Nanoarchaeota archaeon]|nr:radical SAM protein [Nanoarchaeota archaeon]MBU1946130.1 radical SAM protein [Nanoarchaeota archaeon]
MKQQKPPFLKALSFNEDELSTAEHTRLLEFRIHNGEECNLKCNYCVNDHSDSNESELTIEEQKKIIWEAKEIGALTLSILGGGEPTLKGNLTELTEYAYSLGLRIAVFTNMINIDEDDAQEMSAQGVNVIGKLNSFDPKVQELMSGKDGTYTTFQDKIRMFRELGYTEDLAFGLHSVITTGNYREIPALFMWCRELGIVPYLEDITTKGRATPDMSLGRDELTSLFQKLSDIDKAAYGYCWQPKPPIVAGDYSRYRFVCTVDSFGNVYPTEATRGLLKDNIRDKGLREILESEQYQKLRREDKHHA